MRIFFATLLLLSSALFLNCEQSSAKKPANLPAGNWRAVLDVPGGELPFQLKLIREEQNLSAYLVNGGEEVPIQTVSTNGDSVMLMLPAFNSTIRAQINQKQLSGNLTLIKSGGVPQVIPFRATLGEAYRFFPGKKAVETDFSGRWAVTFRDDDGTASEAVGEFQQKGSRLFGTFLTPTGDYRFLEGDVRDKSLYLSCFDGAHAFLFKAKLGEDGQLTGDFWSGTAWHESWIAHRDEKAQLPDAFSLTHLKPGFDRFTFSFPDLNGNAVSLDDPKYRGKVVIVTLAGSWCPNCHDEAKFLSKFYKDYRDKGVEIIGLMYEHYGEFDKAAKQVRRFRKKFDIQYDLLIAGISKKTAAAQTLPALNHVLSFPTTIFIDRNGNVRKIHTGFSGPGTGEHFEQFKHEFYTLIDLLIKGAA